MASVLILGNYRPSYILARTFQKRGFRVICDMEGYEFGAEVSRYVDAIWQHSPFAQKPEKFQQELDAFLAKEHEIQWVCPVTEPLIKAFSNGSLCLPVGPQLLSMAPDLVQKCLDKHFMLSLTQKLEIPVAPFAQTSSKEDLLERATEIGFPIVVRPQSSSFRLEGQKAVTVSALDRLAKHFDIWKGETKDLLIQAHASGKRDNIYFAADDGRITRYLHAKIKRTDQPDGSGLAVEGTTIPPCPILKGHSEKLISALSYSGIGCIQYLVDPQSGEICFLELNPRIAGNHALTDACKLGLDDWFLDHLQGTAPHPAYLEISETVKYSWLAGELESIKQRYRRGTIPLSRVLKAYITAIRAYFKCDIDIAACRHDRRPGFWTLLDSLPFICRLSRLRLKPGHFQTLMLRKDILS